MVETFFTENEAYEESNLEKKLHSILMTAAKNVVVDIERYIQRRQDEYHIPESDYNTIRDIDDYNLSFRGCIRNLISLSNCPPT